MELLDKIESPNDIKNLSMESLTKLCKEIREYMIECCSTNPGHLGASLGAVELAVALHYVFNTPDDKLVWDVGHQAYAHKIITGRREAFKRNRMQGGLSGFIKPSESPYDAFGSGHTSTSISAALGLCKAAELQGKRENVVAIIGDGALSGGLAFEGLNNAGAMKSNLLVIVNDNNISIDKNVGAMHNYLLKISTSQTYNNLKRKIWDITPSRRVKDSLQRVVSGTKRLLLGKGSILFEALGFRYFGTIDGNNLETLIKTLRRIKEIDGPKILHITTTKGKGYTPAEQNQSVWHAPGKFDAATGERITGTTGRKKYQDIFGEAIIALAESNKRIVGITPAMASGCSLNKMMECMPERVFDVGIAEQHAVTYAAGLAAGGALPFCNIYSAFMQRAYDSIIHDVALQNHKVIFCIDRAGLVGEDGATHQGAFDLAYMRSVPGMTVTAPLNEIWLRNLMYSATLPEYKGPISIRYPRGYSEGLNYGKEFCAVPYGKANLLREGKGVAVITLGTIGNRAARAIERVCAKKSGFSPMHLDMVFLKPIDKDALQRACKECNIIITIEDGTTLGALHSAVSEYVAENNYAIKVIPMGIPDIYVEQGTVDQQMRICGYGDEEIEKLLQIFA